MNALTNFQQPIVDWTWRNKYRYTKPDGTSDEYTIEDTHKRVISGIYKNDLHGSHMDDAHALMKNLIWCPAGRIHAGAGTDSRVTLINCFVSPDIEDSMKTELNRNSKGIADALTVAMLTQQMGGGIGMAFHTLRPNGAVVKRTNSVSTGPLPFMGMWDAMCATIKSSGSRRGAMMGTMAIWHPDIKKFITAKHEKGVFTNFNVSVLVTDPFMEALKNNGTWDLGFSVPRADNNHVDVYDKDGKPWYVYERVNARDLWDLITKSTYEYAEPGVIYIDRVNEWNNLGYCEYIQATNPCGEQPLPPDGDCNLGAVNLAPLVKNPFSDSPSFDFDLLKQAVTVGVRFLDNVLDVSLFPTREQYREATAKRRIGLGITGLGNALQMMKVRYGSEEAVKLTSSIMRHIRNAAYRASIELAKERGPFPMFDADEYTKRPFIKTLPEDIQKHIAHHGIRNGVLLTIAPTGTTSLYYNNVSSGLEPTFAWKYRRSTREADGSFTQHEEVYDYGYLMYKEIVGHNEGDELPDYMVNAQQLNVHDHLVMQAACQKYIDASISKTINCPSDMSFEDFQNVYSMAYEMGCKGCTTYRPSGVRGAVLSVDEPKKDSEPSIPTVNVEPRLEELEGTTYKVKYPGLDHAFYITINDYVKDGQRYPFEIFINSKSVKHQEWITALTRMISAIFRRGGDVTFIIEELRQVYSPTGGAFMKGKYIPSLAALFGGIIEKHFVKIGLMGKDESKIEKTAKLFKPDEETMRAELGDVCPSCESPTLFMQEGCKKCSSCGFSECG